MWDQNTTNTSHKKTNNMKKLLAAAVAMGFSAASAVAGPYYSSKSGPELPPPQPLGCVCFDGGSLEVSAFAAGLLPSGDDHGLDDAFGGGIGVGYFFTPNIGMEVNYAVFSEDQAVHLATVNAVVRAPLGDICLAPYFLVGGGVHSNSVTQGIWNIGGGLDWRLDAAGCFGIFADAVYTFAEDTDDYTVIRLGVRKNF